MSHPPCPLCWANKLLRGGYILTESKLFFVYFFCHEDGTPRYALIVPKEHHADMTTLPAGWGEEFGTLYAHVVHLLGGAEHNGYWDEGHTAGQRVMGHWYVRIEPRLEGQPSSGMGLGLLTAKYNDLVAGLEAFASTCTDPEVQVRLRGLLVG